MCHSNALISAVTAAAALLAKGRTDDEVALLGALFTQLGDTLTTISVAKNIGENNEKTAGKQG